MLAILCTSSLSRVYSIHPLVLTLTIQHEPNTILQHTHTHPLSVSLSPSQSPGLETHIHLGAQLRRTEHLNHNCARWHPFPSAGTVDSALACALTISSPSHSHPNPHLPRCLPHHGIPVATPYYFIFDLTAWPSRALNQASYIQLPKYTNKHPPGRYPPSCFRNSQV